MNDQPALYLDGGDDPSFADIDTFLRTHFNARAVYLSDQTTIAALDAALRPYLELLRSPDDQNDKIIRGVVARLIAAGVRVTGDAGLPCCTDTLGMPVPCQHKRTHDETHDDPEDCGPECVPFLRVTGDAGLREALVRMLDEPTTDFHTSASRTLFDKAMRSATQEVTITAQALRMVLPAIEAEAIAGALRAALAPSSDQQVSDTTPVVMDDYMAGYRQAKADAAALAATMPPDALRVTGDAGLRKAVVEWRDAVDAYAALLDKGPVIPPAEPDFSPWLRMRAAEYALRAALAEDTDGH